jgi:hypothetical protein
LIGSSVDGSAVTASLLNRLTIDDELVLLILESLIDNQLSLARSAGALDNDERVGCFHEPCLDLFDVFFSIIPYGFHTSVFFFSAIPMDNVCCVALDPFVEAVVLNVEIPCDMSLDEERTDATSC